MFDKQLLGNAELNIPLLLTLKLIEDCEINPEDSTPLTPTLATGYDTHPGPFNSSNHLLFSPHSS